MLAGIAKQLAGTARKILPEPFAIACGLSVVVYVLALVFGDPSSTASWGFWGRAGELLGAWLEGMFAPGFLAFALQMCLILAAGFGLSSAPAVTRWLDDIASRPRNSSSAVWMISLSACVACWINWGFGLVVSGMLAARVMRRTPQSERGDAAAPGKLEPDPDELPALLMAAAFSGMMIWHGGLSGSAPLLVAADTSLSGSLSYPIPVSETIFSLPNLALTFVLWLVIPWLMRGMLSRTALLLPYQADAAEREATSSNRALAAAPGVAVPVARRARSASGKLSRGVCLLVGFGLLMALGIRLGESGVAAIGLNFVIALFLGLGFLLHRDLASFARGLSGGGAAVTGVIIQFPLYGGIQAVMTQSGLAARTALAFTDGASFMAESTGVAAADLMPLAIFFSAGLVNLFVPSGGGQWIVQGPIVLQAAAETGMRPSLAVMALSYGDQWTNMVQPFWAIPLLGLTGVPIRAFAGYCLLLMVLSMPLFLAALVLWGQLPAH